MESATQFFNNGLGLGHEVSYKNTIGRDKSFAYDPQRLKLLKEKKIHAIGSPISRNSKSQEPRSAMWNRAEGSGGRDTSDFARQQLFVDPRLYGDGGGFSHGESDGDGDGDGNAGRDVVGGGVDGEVGGDTVSTTPESPHRIFSPGSDSLGLPKSGSLSSNVTPPDDAPPKKRKPRRPKKGAGAAGGEEKRLKFLERNRIAASKCREKKKHYVSGLEETKVGLENRHAHLQLEYNSLLTEVSGLKHHLMAHAKCSDPNIDSWLANEARRFVQTTNDLFGSSSYSSQDQSSHPSHTRNVSNASSHQSAGFNSLESASERRDSIAYSQGKPPQPLHQEHLPPPRLLPRVPEAREHLVHSLTRVAPSLYASPADVLGPPLASPKPKHEHGMNYDHMPDNLFSPEQ